MLEASAIKLGNVHPNTSFVDMNYEDFVKAAAAIGQAVDRCLEDSGIAAFQSSVGTLVVEATKAMMEHVAKNTSLGTILLLAPLVGCADRQQLHDRLATLTSRDAEQIYEAIRIAKPGGIGTSTVHDVHASAPANLMIAMSHAANYDDVALQYTTDFELVFRCLESYRELVASAIAPDGLSPIQQLQLRLMTERVDSLIARKGGLALAEEVRMRAKQVYDAWLKRSTDWRKCWTAFDKWLRQQATSDGKQLANPGTIADLIAAVLFLNSSIHLDVGSPS